MLVQLHIRNFAIVPTLEQAFFPGFTAISGETGAGKSILVDALGLLLGARSDASWVRAGEERAELSAEFDLADNPEARTWLRARELDDGDACLLRRSIRANGRSGAWINGTPVTVQQLAELGHRLVEVHGQNEHIRLTGRRRQLKLLDETGGYGDALEAVRAAFRQWRELTNELEALEAAAALPPAEIEFLRFQLKELDETALPADEVTALEQEHRLLSSAGDLQQTLGDAITALDDENGATERIGATARRLADFAELDDDIGAARGMLEEALINCQEALTGLRAAGERIDHSPERLAEVERTLSALGDLARKHEVDIDALEPLRERIRDRLEAADTLGDKRGSLEASIKDALADYRSKTEALSKARRKHAKALAKSVENLMSELGMDGGQFIIGVKRDAGADPREAGDDEVSIEVGANAGTPPGPLSKVASGGELSRISLALRVATAAGGGRTQVFDEVDAGVGGDTANAVGRLLRKSAENGQSLCVTHLAQVAVRADRQLRVSKDSKKDATHVSTHLLEDADRIEEIARMLGGQVSDQSRAHAREMLESSQSTLQ